MMLSCLDEPGDFESSLNEYLIMMSSSIIYSPLIFVCLLLFIYSITADTLRFSLEWPRCFEYFYLERNHNYFYPDNYVLDLMFEETNCLIRLLILSVDRCCHDHHASGWLLRGTDLFHSLVWSRLLFNTVYVNDKCRLGNSPRWGCCPGNSVFDLLDFKMYVPSSFGGERTSFPDNQSPWKFNGLFRDCEEKEPQCCLFSPFWAVFNSLIQIHYGLASAPCSSGTETQIDPAGVLKRLLKGYSTSLKYVYKCGWSNHFDILQIVLSPIGIGLLGGPVFPLILNHVPDTNFLMLKKSEVFLAYCCPCLKLDSKNENIIYYS